jgi:iron complex outermembrane recepter protein
LVKDQMAHPKLSVLALACASFAAAAQDTSQQNNQRIVVSGRSVLLAPDIAGFGNDVPASRTPLQGVRIDDSALTAAGARSLTSLTQLDASLSDAYNSAGYWGALTVRGYTLDQRSNYRRDGLPISAETAIALDNKAALDVLKGISGAQAGVSSPGGLVNFVVKRPTQRLQSATLQLREGGGALASVDVAERWGPGQALGLRVNAAYEHLDPALRHARGHRKLLAAAGDWRPSPATLIEAEAEWSTQRQPSQPGFSLLGNAVPDAKAIDPRLNLNNQSWSQPVVFDGTTASLRLTHTLDAQTQLRWHAAAQDLRTNDRIAFPFGCSAELVFDRYCSDGSFDFYDYRADNERRRTKAMDTSVHTRWPTGGAMHHLSAGVLLSRQRIDLPPQAFNFAGIGRTDGSQQVPEAATPLSEGSAARESSTEWYLRDRIEFSDAWSLWAGLRHTELRRERRQSFTAPWLALAWQVTPATLVYVSAGQGVESITTPSLPQYRNARQALSLKARQVEAGIKHSTNDLDATLAVFDTRRPESRDFGACDGTDNSCERRIDGLAAHRGLELQGAWRAGSWRFGGSAMVLAARRRGASDAALYGRAPANVPSHSARATVAWKPADSVSVALHAAHEGRRYATPDNTARIPGWTRWDATARWEHRAGDATFVWQAGVDNLLDRRAWKESPYQFGHAYLYPLAPREWRFSLMVQR